MQMTWDRGFVLAVCCTAVAGSTASLLATAEDGLQPVVAVLIDGTEIRGRWLSADADSVTLGAGQSPRLRMDELATVSFRKAADAGNSNRTVFYLAAGGRLFGELAGSRPDAVMARTSLSDQTALPFASLAGIRLATEDSPRKAAELFRAALASRLPGKDFLITRDDDVKTVQGRLESLDVGEGSFHFGDRARTFQTDKIFGIVFAEGSAQRSSPPVTVTLTDGASFSGKINGADRNSIALATSFGAQVRLSISDIATLAFRSDRVVYLSDLEPASQRSEGLLHAPWPARRDQNAAAGPLVMAGRTFSRGLGVHSRTTLVYDLGGKYEKLVATIGIDDAVRPRGSVDFQVIGDGKTLYESGVLTGSDAPRDVAVDVSKVKELTLVSDYGDGLDLSDYADWGDARLLKPRRDQ